MEWKEKLHSEMVIRNQILQQEELDVPLEATE